MEITTSKAAFEIEGKHRHTFFNPHGIVYEIGCFSRAPGCTVSGRPTTDFSWFSGFAWRYAHCSGCRQHLGWQFISSGRDFFGLVTSKLTEMERPGD